MKNFIVYAAPLEMCATIDKCTIIDSFSCSSVSGARAWVQNERDGYQAKYPNHTFKLCQIL